MAVNDGRETVGFIDVGTNSIHVLVVRFHQDSSGSVIYHDKEAVRLGRSLYSTGVLDGASIEKCALAVERFASTARELGADPVIAFATCAAREAENRDQLIEAVSHRVDLRIISGTEEARLISLGIFGRAGPSERTIALDIGGGSTEVIVREGERDLFLDSLEMGAVRYRYGKGVDCSLPVSDADYSMFMRSVDLSSYHALSMVRSLGFTRAVGSSGTMLSLAEMCARRRGDGDASYFTLEELHDLMAMLRPMDAATRLTVPGMGKNRADIIIPGGAIAEELMSQFGIDRMEVTGRGLKQGMELDYQLSHGYRVFEAREAGVRALGHRCSFDERHADAVERNSLSLFDQAREMGLHDLDAKWRSLLSCSAILHDVGEIINYPKHNIISQVIIENSELPGFSCDETRAMGMIVRFHHKKFPGPKDGRLVGLTPEDSHAIRVCAMMLKMGDVMDRHRDRSVKGVELTMEGDSVHLRVMASTDPSMEVWSLEKISGDFRKLFGKDLTVGFTVLE